MTTGIEEQIEDAWRAVIDQRQCVRVYLTASGRVGVGDGVGSEVGTYTRAVHLADFRDDVFYVYETIKGR